jgi:hypothetical protein
LQMTVISGVDQRPAASVLFGRGCFVNAIS